MEIDGYLNSKCAIAVDHFVASSAVFFFLHSVFDPCMRCSRRYQGSTVI
jgi:hypothetical protein